MNSTAGDRSKINCAYVVYSAWDMNGTERGRFERPDFANSALCRELGCKPNQAPSLALSSWLSLLPLFLLVEAQSGDKSGTNQTQRASPQSWSNLYVPIQLTPISCRRRKAGKRGAICRTDPELALVSQLPRVRATRQLCERLAELIRKDQDLVARVIASTQAQAAGLQRPDPGELQNKHAEEARITQQIKFVMEAPGDTDEDQAENQTKLAELRRRWANLQAEIHSLQKAAGKQIQIPSEGEVRKLPEQLADVLLNASGTSDERQVAAARRIVHALTGGRIVISQQGGQTRLVAGNVHPPAP